MWVARNRPQVSTNVARQSESIDAKPQAARTTFSVAASPREAGPGLVVDSAVTPAGYSAASDLPAPRSPPPAPELRLPTDRPVRGELLQLKPGLRVRAEGGRARIVVPREGLAVEADRVAFENVDFVPEERRDQRAVQNEAFPALIRLLAAECEFVGCSFQSANGSPDLSAAVVWQQAGVQRPAAGALSSGRIRMKNCVFRRIGVGIESHVQGAIALEIANSLHLGPGPMIRLTHAPAADEPLRITLSQVTLREADALLDCRYGELPDPAGEISIEASGCVLAPCAQAALLFLTSDASPQPLLHEVKWTGQGSVVAGQVVFGRWSGRDGRRQTIDDATISIAGLVHGEVEFAGRFDGEPANSQVVNCQAPLQDSQSAGAATRDLPPEIKEK